MSADKAFNLDAIIRAALAESDAADPHVLAKDVLSRVAKRDLHAALEQALPHMLRQQFGRSGSFATPTQTPGDHSLLDSQRLAVAGPHRSRKVAGIREAWRDLLRQRVAVGDGYKLLAECGIADLEHAASTREDHARRTMARAGQLRHLADLLTEYAVETVAELPEATLRGIANQDGEAAA